MDFSSSFPSSCMLVILTIINGSACADERITRYIGENVTFPLESQTESNFSVKVPSCSNETYFCMSCCNNFGRHMCLNNGSIEMVNVSEKDSGTYEFLFGNKSKSFFLQVFAPLLIVRAHCLSDGKAELFCEAVGDMNDSVYWTLDEKDLKNENACVKEGGRRIILEKGVRGRLACHTSYNPSRSSIDLLCYDGDLLTHPLFLIVLAICGVVAILLAIMASLITCCCMKSKHNFIPVPAEDEKDEGITLSAISSEGQKSPPNGDHCEATEAFVASTANPGPETLKLEPKMDLNPLMQPPVEPGPETGTESGTQVAFREIMVDCAAPEAPEDSFPEPVDA